MLVLVCVLTFEFADVLHKLKIHLVDSVSFYMLGAGTTFNSHQTSINLQGLADKFSIYFYFSFIVIICRPFLLSPKMV